MNEQDTPELLPCPFCGGKPYTRTIQDEDLSTHSIVDWHFVGCSNCDVSFGIPDDYDCGSASEQWNTRAAMPDTTAQADTIKALVEVARKVPERWAWGSGPQRGHRVCQDCGAVGGYDSWDSPLPHKQRCNYALAQAIAKEAL